MTYLALAAASLLVLAFAPAQYLGRQNDDLLYLIAALALPTGRYENLAAVGAPPLTMVSPGWPLLLAPAAALGPGAAQAFSALCAAALPWAVWAWLKERLDARTALLGALVVAASPLLHAQAGTLMPEPAYALLSLGALAAAERARTALAGGLAALLVLVRPAGLSMLPALKRPRAIIPALLAWAAWSAWSRARAGGVQEASELALAFGGKLASLPAVAAGNARAFAAALGGQWLPPALAAGPAAVLLGAAAWALAARGLRRDQASLALAGAVLMHLVWPWSYERYLIPLLPLLLAAWGAAAGPRAKFLFGGMLAASLAFQVVPRLGRPSPWAEPELAAAYAWLRAAPEEGALASALPARDGWHAARPSLPLPDAENAADFAAKLAGSRARFVLRQEGLDLGLSDARRAPLAARLERAYSFLDDEARFRLVFAHAGSRARVYALRRGTTASPTAAASRN